MVSSVFQRAFRLRVLTPSTRPCRMDAHSLIFPATDGQMGILPGRAPMIAMIGAGTLIAISTEGEKEVFYISGGFAHVRENEVTIMAEECIRQADIDPEQAWEQLQDARKMPTTNDEELAVREQAILAAEAKFNLAQKLRKQSQKRS